MERKLLIRHPSLAMEGVQSVHAVQGVCTKDHEIKLDKYRESGSLIEKGCTERTVCTEEINILERVKSGMVQDVCTISVTHSRPTLSTKDLQYGKVHENGENERGAEIPSKLN